MHDYSLVCKREDLNEVILANLHVGGQLSTDLSACPISFRGQTWKKGIASPCGAGGSFVMLIGFLKKKSGWFAGRAS